jgi:hypothetical protein
VRHVESYRVLYELDVPVLEGGTVKDLKGKITVLIAAHNPDAMRIVLGSEKAISERKTLDDTLLLSSLPEGANVTALEKVTKIVPSTQASVPANATVGKRQLVSSAASLASTTAAPAAKKPKAVAAPRLIPGVTSMCECGGVTGVPGTAGGAKKWRSHYEKIFSLCCCTYKRS